jgi:hypothetical protein
MRHGRLYILLSILVVMAIVLLSYHYKEWAAEKARADEEAEKLRIEELYAKLPEPPDNVPPNVPKSIAKVLEAATEIKLVSLVPWYLSKDPSNFVIGSTVVKDPETIKRIRETIYVSIVSRHAPYSACDFEPRHSLDARAGDVVLHLTICFHCGEAIGEIRHTRHGGNLDFGKTAEPVLNEILTARGVPLSPK